MDGLYRMAQIRDRRDLEQDLAISGGSADASPSVAPARSRHDKRDEDWWMGIVMYGRPRYCKGKPDLRRR